MPEMSDSSSSKFAGVVEAWQVALPLPRPPGGPGEVGFDEYNATASPIRVGSTGTIVSLMEREEEELKRSRKEGKLGPRRKSAAAMSRLFHTPDLGGKTEAISVSCGLPLMTARNGAGSGAKARAAKLKKTQRRQQLLQRDFRSCRVPRDGETPRFLSSTRSTGRHRRKPSADSVAMLLDASFEADRTAQEMSDCRIGRRPSVPSRLASLTSSGKEEVTLDTVNEPWSGRLSAPRGSSQSIGVSVRKTVTVKGSTRVALVPFAQGERTMSSTKSPEDEVNKKDIGSRADYGMVEVLHNNSPDFLSEAGSSPSLGSTAASSGRPSSASKRQLQQENRIVGEGTRSDATNSTPPHSSRREEGDVARQSTSSDSSCLQEAVRPPSRESSPISIEELRKSLLADRATKRLQQQQQSLPTSTSKESPVYRKEDVLTLRIPAPEPFQGQLHRESPRLREVLRESPRLRDLQMESPILREFHMGQQSLREWFSSPKPAADPPQQSSAPRNSASPKSYNHVLDKMHQEARQTTHTTTVLPQQQTRMIQRGLTNPTLKPGSSSSRVLPFVKYDTDEETELTDNAKVKLANKSRNLEGATTPLRGSRKAKHASRKAPALVSLSCSRPSWRKHSDTSVPS